MSQLPFTVPSHAREEIVTFKSMLWLAVLFIREAEPLNPPGSTNAPSAKAPKPEPPSEPYLINGNWPAPSAAPIRLMVTVEAGVSAPLTLMTGDVGLPKEFRSKFNVEPALTVNDDIFSELPAPATCTSNVALFATVYAPAPLLAVVTTRIPALFVVLPL